MGVVIESFWGWNTESLTQEIKVKAKNPKAAEML